MKTLAITLCLLGTDVYATEDGWPALHDVVDVAPDDVLNIRAEPSASSRIVGTFAPDATSIEVVGPALGKDGWGVVNVMEQTGYVSLNFLRRHENTYHGSALPIRNCFGTEPFWQLDRRDGVQHYRAALGEQDWVLAEHSLLANVEDRKVQVRIARSVDRSLTLYTRLIDPPYYCRDGMSDRSYGIHASLLVEGPDGATLQTGCCSLGE